MPRVLVSDSISDRGLDILRGASSLEVTYRPGLKEPELVEAIGEFDALVIRSATKVTAKVLESAGRLRLIGRAGIGIDNVDVGAASKRGIVVMNTPTGNAVTTAEHAISLMLAVARRIPQASASMRQGKWEKTKFSGRELAGKTLGILGLGNIGRIVADRGRGLRMNVIAYDPVLTADRASALGVELVSLDELWKRADVISAHTPLTAETRGIVNDATVEKLRPGVLLVNAARGGIYDEGALLRGLEGGRIGGVALDVFAEEPPKSEATLALLKHELVVATPHLGASTEEAQERVVAEIAEQVVAYFSAGIITNAVNVPAVPQELAGKIAPYLELGRKLGGFVAQAGARGRGGSEPSRVEVECLGEAAALGPAPIVNAALAGYLAPYLEGGRVNAVSAPILAQDRGIEVKTLSSAAAPRKGFATVVAFRVRDAERGVAGAEGTLAHDGTPRLTSWMGFELDAHLQGEILVIENEDRPGVIGAVGTIVGRRGINVSRMQVGLDAATKRAVALWAVDAPLSADALVEVRSVAGVTRAIAVSIG